MLKKFTLLLAGILLLVNLYAQIPAGYYDAAASKTGETLRAALRDITTSGHVKLPYTSTAFDVWNAYAVTDVRPSPNNTTIWDMYSDIPSGSPLYTYTIYTNQCGTSGGEGDCYSREHCMPNSWWGGLDNTANPQYTDLHHLFACDQYVNMYKSNYPIGQTVAYTYISSNGSKVGPCSYPGYTGKVFEPINEYKGDFARAWLYLATRYMNVIGSWVTNYPGYDSQYLIDPATNNYKTWFKNMMLEWHNNDPVSQKETDRNNAIYYNTPQHNRNPYIDHPEYVCLVWGTSCVSGPVITNVAISPAIPTPTDSVNVSADITDDGSILTAILYWDVTPGTFSNSIAMNLGSAPEYVTTSTIPAQLEGTTIYYKIVATDNESNVTTSDVYTYNIPQGEPTNHPTGFTCGTTTSSAITLSWTDAIGAIIPNGYLIKMSAVGFASIVDPVDNVPEADGASTKNVAAGLQACTFTGLTSNTTYYFIIYAYSNSGTNINYKLIGTEQSSSCPTIAGGGGSEACISEGFAGGITAAAGWTYTNIGTTYTGAGYFYVTLPSLKFDASGDIVVTPTVTNPVELSFWIRGVTTDAASAFNVEGYNGTSWSTIENITNSIPTSGIVKTYNSASTPALAADFTQFRFTYTKSAGNVGFDSVRVICETGCTKPTIQSTGLLFNTVTSNSMIATWTRGTGNNVLVLAKAGSAVDTEPVSGTAYNDSDIFGSGDQLGTGNFVVYNGPASSVNVTGLTPSTTYYFAIYEYNDTEICYKTPGLTGNQATSAPVIIPTLTTNTVTAISTIAATSGGIITADGGSAVTARGVCWNTTGTPTIASSKTIDGTGTGAFISSLTGLATGTTYYVRAYATNVNGTAYGNEEIFVTLRPEPSNSPTAFSCGTTTSATIPLSWTAATGAVLPHGYLVKASPVGFSSIPDPADGIPEPDDVFVKNIAFGTNSCTFTGLNSNTTYYYKIYSYTNSNSDINYKTDGTLQTTSCTTVAVPVTIWYQGFESSPQDTWTYAGGASNSTTYKYVGANSRRINSAQTVTFNNVSLASYSSVNLSVAFSGINVGPGENLYLDISYDNGATWTGTGSATLVNCNQNSSQKTVAFGATSATRPITVASNPWVVAVSGTYSQIAIRLRCATMATGTYYIDDIKLTGIFSCTYPAAFNVTGGGSFCSGGTGVSIGLDGSVTGVNYQLMNGTTAIGSPVAGTGSPLSFGLQITGGTYYVIATNGGTSCSSNMNGTAIVTVNPAAAASLSISANPGTTVCTGSSVTYTATPVNGGTSPTYQWKRNSIDIAGATGLSYLDIAPSTGDLITCVMTSNAPCVTGSPSTSNTLILTVSPYSPASVSIAANPAGTVCSGTSVTFTATPVNGGTPSYQWKVNGITAGTNSATFISSTFNNSDAVTCVMTANGSCATGSPATSNTVTMTVTSSQPVSVSIAAVPAGSIVAGTNVTFTATPVNGGTPTYVWKVNGGIVGTNSNTYSSSALSNNDIVTCVMTSDIACPSGSPATSNTITMAVTTNFPVITNVVHSPAAPSPTDVVSVSADVTDDAVISSVNLLWCTDVTSFGNSIVMNAGTAPAYTTATSIPAQIAGTIVYYKIVATDNGAHTTTSAVFTYNVTSGCAGGSQVTIFTETMGTVAATTLITAHETANGFDNDAYTMGSLGCALPGDIRATSVSAGYTGASGVANIWLTSTNNEYGFSIEGINSSVYTNLLVSFGFRKESASALPTLALEYSTDGSNWNAVTFTYPVAANAAIAWYLISDITLPAAAQVPNLRLRWRKTGTVACRIDDVVLKGTNNPYPTAYTITGGGSYCTGGTGVAVGVSNSETGKSYQLKLGGTNTGTPVTGNGAAITFGNQTSAGTYTVVATNTTSGCQTTMTGSAVVVINALPTAYTVTGGGSYCSGGTGAVVGLSNTQSGVNYQLMVGGSPTGSPAAGTGTSLNFGAQTAVGNYTVNATNTTTTCTNTMSGSVTITTNPLPALFTVTGGGAYCTGGSGMTVGLDGSVSGVSYQLKKDGINAGAPLAGTGAALNFGNQTEVGLYTVEATIIATSCVATMNGNTTISLNALPVAYNVTGGGALCNGGSGVTVGLSGSETSINYQLQLNGSNLGAPTSGTGSALSFGPYTIGGNYTLIATHSITGCIDTMNGSAVITVNPNPAAFAVTGGGSYCIGGSGVTVGLANSQSGVNYQLKVNGLNTGSPVAGTNAALNFGNQTAAGNYTVSASNETTGCANTMTGSAGITVNSIPVAYNVTGGGSFCDGGSGVEVGLDLSETGITYQLKVDGTLTGTAVPGTGAAINFGLQTLAGTYTVVAENATTHCVASMAGSVLISINTLFPVASVSSVPGCGTGTVTVTSDQTGLQLFELCDNAGIMLDSWNGNAGSYTFTGLANGSYKGKVTYGGCISTLAGPETLINTLQPVATILAAPGCGAGTITITSNQNGLQTFDLCNSSGGVLQSWTGTDSARNFNSLSNGTFYGRVTLSGCASTLTPGEVLANNPAPTAFTVSGGGAYCSGGAGLPVNLSNSKTGIQYFLLLNGINTGDSIGGTDSAISFGNQTNAGTYTIRAKNASTLCENNMSGNAVIIVNPLPTANAVNNGPVCEGSALSLTGGSDAMTSYTWAGPDSYSSSVQSPVVSSSVTSIMAGTYYLTVTDTNSCSDTASTTVIVTPMVIAGVTIVASANPICAGTSVTFTATPVNGGTTPVYQWYLNGSPVGTNLATYTSNTLNNGDNVTVTLTSSLSCISGNPATSNTIAMNVNTALPVSVSIASAPAGAVCVGTSVTFTATPVNGGAAPIYQWYLNGSPVGTNLATYTSNTLNNGDNVTVTLTSSLSCILGNPATSNTIAMNVNTALPVSVSIASAPAGAICVGTSVTFTATPVNGGAAPVYQWYLNGSPVGTNLATYTSNTLNNGDNVTATLSSSLSCISGSPATSNTITQNVTPLYAFSESHAICQGSSYAWQGSTYTTAGVFTKTYATVNGCDSIYTLNLSVNPVYAFAESHAICQGSSYSWQGSTYTTAGVFTKTYATVNGCDSIYTLNLSVNPVYAFAESHAICQGSSYSWQGSTYTTAGVFTKTYATVNGCDSIYTLNLSVNPVYAFNENHAICQGSSYAWQGSTYTTVGVFTKTYATVNGCDSVYTLNLSVNPVYAFAENHAICQGSSYAWQGSTYTTTGVFTKTYATVNGCDSVYTLNLSVNPVYAFNENHAICQGSSYSWQGGTYTTVGVFTKTYATINGCDSVYTLNLTVDPGLPVNVSITASANNLCPGVPVTFTATPVNGGITPVYQWYLNGSPVGTNLATYTSNTLNEGDNVTVTLTSSLSCISGNPATSNTIAMNVNTALPVSVSIASAPAGAVCVGTSVTFTATPVNGGATPVYQWYLNGSPVGTNLATYTSNTLNEGDNVTVTLISSLSCISGSPALSNAITMTVGTNSTASVSIVTSANPICTGTSVMFTATPVNGGAVPVYQWYLNGSPVGTNTETYTNNTLNDGDNVIVTLISSLSCVSGNPATSNAITMIVGPMPTTSVSIVASDNPICTGTSVVFTATPVNGGTTPVYDWFLNGVSTGINNATYTSNTLNNGDTVTVTLTSSLSCISGNPATSNTIAMNVNTALPVSVSIASAPAGAVCAGTSVTFTATPVNGGTTPVYQWYLNGSPVGANLATYTSNMLNNGDNVTVTLSSSLSCIAGSPATSNIITLNVTPLYAFAESHAICQGSSYSWQGSTYTTAGVFTKTYATVNGCDSVYTLNLSVNPVYAFAETHAICQGSSYSWQGSTYTTAGVFTKTYATSNGCDSIYTLNLSVNPVYAFNESHAICQGAVYTWQGSTYTTAGIFTKTYATVNGCDSVYTLNLSVNPVFAFAESHAICQGASYTWQGSTYTTAGVFTKTYATVNGCDSVYTLNLSVNPVYAFAESHAICEGASYAWQGSTYTTAGVFTKTYATVNGCDSVYTLNLSVNPVYAFAESHAICEGASYAWQGSTYTTAGVFTKTYATVNGCDSVYTLNLSVNPVFAFAESHAICQGASYAWQGSTYTTAGVFTKTYATVNGCDSVYTLNLSVNPVYVFNESHAICQGSSYVWQGSTYTTAGVFTKTYATVNGCDSIYTLNLSINPVYAFAENHAICQGSSYAWQGSTYTTAGVFTKTYATVNGCDSIYTLNLSVNPVYAFAETHAICQGASYAWQGSTYTTAGVFTKTYATVNGCDSVYTLNLSVNPVFAFAESHAICEGASYAWQGSTYTTAGVFTKTYATVNGCDSVYTLNLSVNPTYAFAESHAICQGASYTWQGSTYTTAGVFTKTYATVNGCDSVYTLNLSVNPVYAFAESHAICEGASYAWQGSTYTTAGVFTKTYATVNGCDSVYTLNLSVNPVYAFAESHAICEGASYAWQGSTYTTAGVFTKTYATVNGCDSVYTLNLSVNPTYAFAESHAICQGSSYAWQGSTYTTAGVFTKTYATVNGCDSIYTLNLSVNPVFAFAESHAICQGASYTWQGSTYTTAGVFTKTYATVNGCDSVYTLNLSVNPVYAFAESHAICQGASYAWQGSTYTTSGIFTKTYATVNGCDSVYTLNLSVNPVFAFAESHAICQGASYAWQGSTYTTAGVFTKTYATVNGCDSVYTLNLSVNPVYAFAESHAICQGSSYAWQGSTYTTAGVFTKTYATVNGCDSVYTLNLSVHPVYAFAESHAICQGSSYAWQGSTYTTAGVFTKTYTTVNGCDSIYTLNLSVNPVYAFAESHAICQGASYAWQGSTYTTAGVFTKTYATVNGCDSVYTLNLSVNPVYAFNENHAICQGSSYSWQGGTYTTVGVFTKTYATINGCDSVYTLNLTVDPGLPVNVSITASANNLCPGVPVTFTATPVNGGATPVYDWLVNGISTGTTSATYTRSNLTDGDNVSLSLSSSLSCISGNPATSDTIIMVVYNNPVVDLGLDITICGDQSVELDAGAGFSGYEWSNGSGNPTLLIDSTVAAFGTSTYAVTVTDLHSCKATDTISVTLTHCTGIADADPALRISCGPNPAHDYVNIIVTGTEEGKGTLWISDMAGKIVMLKDIDLSGKTTTVTLDISPFAKGIYHLQLKTNKEIYHNQIIHN